MSKKQITISTTEEVVKSFKAGAEAAGLTNGQYLEQLLTGKPAEAPKETPKLPRFRSTIVYQRNLLHPEVQAENEAAAKQKILEQYPHATIHQVIQF